MKHLTLILFFGFTGTILSFAQPAENCNCCSPAHDQFDFWIGEWEVFNTEGKKIGENQIEKLEANCLLSETWNAESGSSGRSMNYYNSSNDTWNQLWVSSSGNILKLNGKAGKNSMILKSETMNGENGKYINQITWSLNEDGSVTQYWEILDENGNFLSEVFKGIYRKKVLPTEN